MSLVVEYFLHSFNRGYQNCTQLLSHFFQMAVVAARNVTIHLCARGYFLPNSQHLFPPPLWFGVKGTLGPADIWIWVNLISEETQGGIKYNNGNTCALLSETHMNLKTEDIERKSQIWSKSGLASFKLVDNGWESDYFDTILFLGFV